MIESLNRNGLPLVSVCVITYNHKNYISQCLDAVLMQQTKFPFEIILGEDESLDGTREICKEYANKYPQKIRLYLRSRKDVIYINGTPTGRFNLIESIKAARGKYIAICEGDDYWTDPFKLQKQVDFLEANSNYAICFHNAKILYEDDPAKVSYSNCPDQLETSTFEHLAKGEYIYTCTCLFRAEDFKKFPKKFVRHINNYTIDLHNAQFGKIKYINEVMSVYRVHKGGIWSMVPRDKTLINQLPAYKFYLNYFDQRYKKYFLTHLKNMTSELISIKLANNDFKNFWKYYKDYVFYNAWDKKEIKRMGYAFLKVNYKNIRSLFKRI